MGCEYYKSCEGKRNFEYSKQFVMCLGLKNPPMDSDHLVEGKPLVCPFWEIKTAQLQAKHEEARTNSEISDVLTNKELGLEGKTP